MKQDLRSPVGQFLISSAIEKQNTDAENGMNSVLSAAFSVVASHLWPNALTNALDPAEGQANFQN